MRPIRFLLLENYFLRLPAHVAIVSTISKDLLRLYPGPFERFKACCQRTELAPVADEAMERNKSAIWRSYIEGIEKP